MAYVKSDQVKQSVDNLEKYRLFTEDKLKLFVRKKIRPVWYFTPKDHAGRRNVSFTHTTPINSRGKNNHLAYSRSFLPVWHRAGVVCTECLLIFGTYSIGFILGSYFFHGLNTLRKL